jgi:hypothetical protein
MLNREGAQDRRPIASTRRSNRVNKLDSARL